MEKPVLILFLSLYLMILNQASLAHSQLPENVKAEGYRLHLQWASSFCFDVSCRQFIKQLFTIHGLYFLNNNRVVNCPGEPLIPDGTFKDIEQQLGIEWLNLKGSTPNLKFWTHEWQKHGSCHDTWTAKEYFQNALAVRETVKKAITTNYRACSSKGDVYCALSQKSITPSLTLSRTPKSFIVAFDWMFGSGTSIGVRCTGNRLLELIFCFDVNLKLQPCSNQGSSLIESCAANIFYVPDKGIGMLSEMDHPRNASLPFLPLPEAKGAVEAV